MEHIQQSSVIVNGRQVGGYVSVTVDPDQQFVSAGIMKPADTLAVPVTGLVDSVLISARNETGDAVSVLCTINGRDFDLGAGPIAWHRGGHAHIAELVPPIDGVQLENIDDQNAQISFAIGLQVGQDIEPAPHNEEPDE